jgi:sulfocyanin
MLRSLPAVLLVMVVLRQPGADCREPVRNNNAWCYDTARGRNTLFCHATPVPGNRFPAVQMAALSDSTSVNQYMWYDMSARTVQLSLNAGVGTNNGGMNFNGGATGSQTITVPAGWKVRIHFKNLDAIPHSAIIIADQPPLPSIPQTPAFGAAYTRDLTGGLFTDQTDDLNFTAGAAGKYVLVCGVPGHGPSGMWIRFVVSAEAAAPSYAM